MNLTWIGFLKTFPEKYISEAYVDRKNIKFLELRPNDLSMVDYESQFGKLLKYIFEEITTVVIK